MQGLERSIFFDWTLNPTFLPISFYITVNKQTQTTELYRPGKCVRACDARKRSWGPRSCRTRAPLHPDFAGGDLKELQQSCVATVYTASAHQQ